MTWEECFAKMARTASVLAGSVWLFTGSLVAFALWLALGPVFHWNDLFHLWPTSLLTWATWLIVVLIQHEQVHQETVLHRKVDALIEVHTTDNRLIRLEEKSPAEIQALTQPSEEP